MLTDEVKKKLREIKNDTAITDRQMVAILELEHLLTEMVEGELRGYARYLRALYHTGDDLMENGDFVGNLEQYLLDKGSKVKE